MIKCIIDEVFVKASVDSRIYGKITQENLQSRMLKDARALLGEIKRHCDGADSLEIDDERRYECSFCGSAMEDEEDYRCCDDSIEEHEQLIAKEKD